MAFLDQKKKRAQLPAIRITEQPILLTKRKINCLGYKCSNHNYIKILESDWSSAGLISAVIVQLHTSCACNWTVVRVMPE